MKLSYDFAAGTLPLARYAVDKLLRDADLADAGSVELREALLKARFDLDLVSRQGQDAMTAALEQLGDGLTHQLQK